MVLVEDYEIQLVEATTKAPFKEHTDKDGNVYVEVEPHAEYYIGVCKKSNHHGITAFRFFVDGKYLNYCKYRYRRIRMDSADYYGFRSVQGHETHYRALKFLQPKMKPGTDSKIDCFGTVVMEIFEDTKGGNGIPDPFEKSRVPFQPVTEVHLEEEDAAPTNKKKYLRSGIGSTCLTRSSNIVHFGVGPILKTVTLRYCSVYGLVQAGILAVPATSDRPFPIAKRSASASTIRIKTESFDKRRKSEMKMTGAIVEITDSESTDDEIEEIEKPNPEVIDLSESE